MTAAELPKNPFVREGHVDKPGIVGSHWWNRQLAEASALQTRRALLTALGVSAVGITALGAITFAALSEDTHDERRRSLEMQQDYGWGFGATSETVAFDAQYTTTYAADALPRLATDLAPKNQSLSPWFVPSLLLSPTATPRRAWTEPPPETPVSLATALKPIHTPTMDLAERRAGALVKLLAEANGGRIALILDLDGPESVAAAAGAASVFDPVFVLDNWPHPKAVVPAHLTLAAAVYYQPQLVKLSAARSAAAPPALVLDRKRLSPYSDDAAEFDNRWLAKFPAAKDLWALEIKRVLYVAPAQTGAIAPPDAAQALHDWAAVGIDVRAIALDAFLGSGTDLLFGGRQDTHASFFAHYPWKAPEPTAPLPKAPGVRPPPAPPPVLVPVPENQLAAAYKPSPSGLDPGAIAMIGTILVAVQNDSSEILGPSRLRSGSWNRASGGWGG